MRCPKCDIEMQKGQLGSTGNLWMEKIVSTTAVKFLSMSKAPFVFAYRCPNCGKVELISEIDK